MAYQALYRKWRPQTFEQVLGQTATVKTLRRQIEDGRIAHAYLFCGCRGTGKTTMAKLMSRAINCLNPSHGDPCGQCEACRAIISETTMDVLELDAASNNGVDQVRALREEAVYTPAVLKKRVYIIDEVHMLSTPAFNALLKILEEPPEHLMFILATTELHKVPATILSRCQRFSFKRILPRDMERQLLHIAQAEKIDLTADGAEILSRMAGGALRDALSLLDQCRVAEGQLTSRAVLDVLGLFRPFDQGVEWVAYSTAGLVQNGQTIGVLLLTSPMQGTMERLFTLQDKMILYFLIAAGVAMVIALVFSRVITRPIVSLTRSIQRMGRGDLSVRVPVKGSGELRRLSETFNTMSEKLEMLDKSRNQFVSNASHELKTPLATMKILLESIIYQPDMDAGMRTEFLTDINKEIDRLNLIISDLLTLVSMDSKTMRLNRTTFSLAQVVTDTAHRLALVMEKRHQELKLQLNDRCDMYADCAKLTQVVYNLMENASKYTQEGGVIRVRLIRSGRDAILTVSDNGPGIPKEDQSHIFDRFYRVDKARSRETGGTGLGLSIVHQMVLMHGGTVTVDSEEGNGATFTVELPIHQG